MEIVLVDFGISKFRKDGLSKSVVGTYDYIDPYITKCRDTLSDKDWLKADIWGVGLILYELCTLNNDFALLETEITIPDNYDKRIKTEILQKIFTNPEYRPSIDQIMQTSVMIEQMRDCILMSNTSELF